jgi:hypothetical protein
MKIKSLAAGLIIATAMVATVGVAQAKCYKHTPGWHMVSKKCNIQQADNWQEYASGVYLRPAPSRGLLPFMNR